MNNFPGQGGRVQSSASAQPQATVQSAAARKNNKFIGGSGGGPKTLSIIVVAVIAVILLVSIIGAVLMGSNFGPNSVGSQINKKQYQAVFLNNTDGQVYFGKLKDLNSQYYKLTDIYYVKVDKTVQSGQATDQSNISLAKLGSEIHAPEDVMYINKSSVMFWENLQPSGQVVKAIVEYKKNPTPNGTTNTQAK